MMYKEGEKVRYIGENYPDLQNALFYVDEIDIEDSHLPLKIESETGIMSVWVSYDDVELIKVGVDHADTDKQNESVSSHLFRVESKIDELAEALKMINEKIDKMNEGKDVEVTFDKDELVIKPKFKDKVDAIWEKPSTSPPNTAKLHTGEVIVPHSKIDDLFDSITAGTINASDAIVDALSAINWKPKDSNELRKELIEEAKRLTKEVTENREHYFGEKFYFYVNPDKRVVTCVVKDKTNLLNVEFPKSKGIARCSPEDVFNEDIGKYIAMCRATGHTIPEKFLDPVQPDKLVKGFLHTISELNGDDSETRYVDSVIWTKAYLRFNGEKHWIPSDITELKKEVNDFSFKMSLDDTNAEY